MKQRREGGAGNGGAIHPSDKLMNNDFLSLIFFFFFEEMFSRRISPATVWTEHGTVTHSQCRAQKGALLLPRVKGPVDWN